MAGYPIGRAAPTQPLGPRAGMWGVRPWLALWPLALWALAIFIASCFVVGVPQFLAAVNAVLPDDESKARFAEFWRQYWWVVVKGFHAFEFAVIFWLANSSLRRFDRAKTPPRERANRWYWVVAWFIAVGYGALDEWHQSFVPERGALIRDFLVDTGGASVALLVSVARSRRRG